MLFEGHGIDSRYTGPHPVAPTMSARYGTGGNNAPLPQLRALLFTDARVQHLLLQQHRAGRGDAHLPQGRRAREGEVAQAQDLRDAYARGTATADSDIDLLIDISGTKIKSLLQLSEVLCDFEDAFGKRVDLVTTRSLEQPIRMPSDVYFRENLRNERVEIYAVA